MEYQENDVAECLRCGVLFSPDLGRRCPDCYPQDHDY